MNVLDSITKTPSQVLVKSATNFGQDAAKIMGAYAEECIKNSTDDILHEMRDATQKLSETMRETLTGFSDTFHKTGVEAFTEWGIGIERAFLHLGQKLETGLTNSTNRMAYTIRDTMDETLWRMRRTITSSSNIFTDAFMQFGLKHAEVYKQVFRHEIIVLLICSVLVSFSLCIFAISAATKIGLTGALFEFAYGHFVPICFVGFALLNAYVIFASTHSSMASSLVNVPVARSANVSNAGGNTSGEHASSETKDKSAKDNISDSSSAKPQPAHNQNGIVVYAIVATIGYMAGNLSTQVFTYSSLNFLVSFVIMLGVTLLAYKVLAFNILYKMYAFYYHLKEFQAYLKEKQRREVDRRGQDNSHTEANASEPAPSPTAEPFSASSTQSTAAYWSEEDEELERYRETLRQRRIRRETKDESFDKHKKQD